MSTEAPRGPNIRELESLRIARTAQPKKPSRLIPAAITIVILAVVGAAGYVVYQKTLGRPPEVQTAIVSVKQAGQAGTVLTGSGYVITQHKYIVIGTKILGQIVAEPIEEGQRVKVGDLLARIDDRDYQAQLKQAYADRDLAAAEPGAEAGARPSGCARSTRRAWSRRTRSTTRRISCRWRRRTSRSRTAKSNSRNST